MGAQTTPVQLPCQVSLYMASASLSSFFNSPSYRGTLRVSVRWLVGEPTPHPKPYTLNPKEALAILSSKPCMYQRTQGWVCLLMPAAVSGSWRRNFLTELLGLGLIQGAGSRVSGFRVQLLEFRLQGLE